MKEPFNRIQKEMKETYFQGLEFGEEQRQRVIKKMKRRQRIKTAKTYGNWFLSAAAVVCLFFVSFSFILGQQDTGVNGGNPFVQTPVSQKAYIDGLVKTQPSKILFYVESNLPEGTLVHLVVESPEFQPQTVRVGKNGYFSVKFDRPEFDKYTRVKVIFKPAEQTETIRKLYGNRGQKLTGDYVFQYKKEGIVYFGAYGYTILTPDTDTQHYQEENLYPPGQSPYEVILRRQNEAG